jgi:hypothetical protein
MPQIPVAILSAANFYARSELDRITVTFGATDDEVSLRSCSPKAKDVNRDGLDDLECAFDKTVSGFQCGDAEGKTVSGRSFEVKRAIVITGCK